MDSATDILTQVSEISIEDSSFKSTLNCAGDCGDYLKYGSKSKPTVTQIVEETKEKRLASSTNVDNLTSTSTKVENKGLVQLDNKDKHAAVERYSLYPLVDPDSFAFYKKQMANFWVTDELGTFTTDRDHYHKRLTPPARRLLDIALAFFLPGDGLVNNNLAHNFLLEAVTMEEQMMFIAQMAIEAVHAETYGLIVYMIHGLEGTRRLQAMVADSEYMQLKIDAMEKWTVSTRSRAERLLAWACVEGIFFSVLFAIIFWFRSQGNLLPTVVLANELISRDETLHRDYACYLFRTLAALDQASALEIVKYFVNIEERFIDWLLEEEVQELTRHNLKQYLYLVADNLLVEAGLPKYFNGSCPFPWMNDIALVQKHNFYELRGGSYTKASIKDSTAAASGIDNGVIIKDAYENPGDVDF